MPPKAANNKKIIKDLDEPEKTHINEESDDSDDESVNDSDDDSDDESVNESVNDEDNNSVNDEDNNSVNDEDKNVDKKEKQKKLNHDELLTEINKIKENESILESEISELEKILVLKVKSRSTFRRNKNKYILLLSKEY